MVKKIFKTFKINNDTMTTIVIGSILFCVLIVVWGMIQSANGIDSSSIVDSALRVFGTELGICGVMTIFNRWNEAQDRRIEERRLKKEMQNQNEI